MTDDRKAPDAAQHISAASEERFIASTEEFASESSKATVLATNVIQALLVACVVLWVLDVPRQVLNVSFYTEQLLAVTLGLTLALAFIAETSRQPSAIDLGGAVRGGRHRHLPGLPLLRAAARSPGRWSARSPSTLAWTFTASRAAYSRWFDWLCAIVSLLLARLHHRPLRGADL